MVGEVREVGDGDRVLETPVRVERESARTVPGAAADVAAPTGAVRSAT